MGRSPHEVSKLFGLFDLSLGELAKYRYLGQNPQDSGDTVQLVEFPVPRQIANQRRIPHINGCMRIC